MKKLFQYLFDTHLKSEWKKVENRNKLIEQLSEASGLKKIYFQTLTEQELQAHVVEYSKAGLL